MHLDSDPSALRLASAVELRLAEYSSGHLPVEQLKSELRSLLIPFETNVEKLSNKGRPESSTSIKIVDAGELKAPPSEIQFLAVSLS